MSSRAACIRAASGSAGSPTRSNGSPRAAGARRAAGLDGRLPQSVETALYFTVAEALTNVAKYADATRVRVSVALEDGHATAEIADDGSGGAVAAGGSGLRGLADRLEAIGGTLDVESPAGGGTVVRARVPLP